MTSRTVMAARLGPASLRIGPRSVYICAPTSEGAKPHHQELIDAVLKKVIRPDDRLLYPGYPGASHFDDPVVAFAERYGLFADPIGGERTPPTLTILIVDPLGDNALSAPARVLATQRRADLIITELPVLID